jgi:hypothetical protein
MSLDPAPGEDLIISRHGEPDLAGVKRIHTA